MSKRVFASGTMQDGKIHVAHRIRFDDMVARTFKEGERVMLTVEKSTRTLRQNNLLWYYNNIVAESLGWDPEDVQEYDKPRIKVVHRTRIDKKTGEMIDIAIPKSTRKMAVDEFAEMIAKKQQLWAEEGIDLPSPNDEEYS